MIVVEKLDTILHRLATARRVVGEVRCCVARDYGVMSDHDREKLQTVKASFDATQKLLQAELDRGWE